MPVVAWQLDRGFHHRSDKMLKTETKLYVLKFDFLSTKIKTITEVIFQIAQGPVSVKI